MASSHQLLTTVTDSVVIVGARGDGKRCVSECLFCNTSLYRGKPVLTVCTRVAVCWLERKLVYPGWEREDTLLVHLRYHGGMVGR